MALEREQRPALENLRTEHDVRRWYWTKDELLGECRRLGLKTTGGKFRLLDRIVHFHTTGERKFPGDVRQKVRSSFNWHSEPLSRQTQITDSYKNSQNVRRFFQAEVGPHFKFNRAFMAWMKENVGKTLEDAIAAFHAQAAETAKPGFKTEIADHNQFNQYTRDFLADNPDLGMKDVRHYWALKRALPSDDGRHRYHPSDLELTP